jgi:hypothetical protein
MSNERIVVRPKKWDPVEVPGVGTCRWVQVDPFTATLEMPDLTFRVYPVSGAGVVVLNDWNTDEIYPEAFPSRFWTDPPPNSRWDEPNVLVVTLTDEEMVIPDRREFRKLLAAKIQVEGDRLMAEWERRHPDE